MWKKIGLVVLFTMVPLIFSCEKVIENRIHKGLHRQNTEILNDEKMHIFLVGSGGPINNSKRTATCTAIIAGGMFVLVDAGPGTWRNADLLDLPLAHLNAILLTHFHSDHIGDLGEANFGSWVAGRVEKLVIYGPPGVAQVVDGFRSAYALDTTYRVAHHGVDVLNPQSADPISETIRLPDDEDAQLVFQQNGLKAYAFAVDHSPVDPAFGYRFEYKGNRVVITGDTKKTATLSIQAKNADLLISNALSFKFMEMISRAAAAENQPRMAKIARDVMNYQLDPLQAAEVAEQAHAKTLVLAHIVPPVTNWFQKRLFLEGIKEIYQGKVVMGEDGMAFVFDPRQPD